MFSPPTDSLYKFLAIFGLISLGWSQTFPAQREADYRILEAELRAGLKAAAAQANVLTARYDALSEAQKNLDAGSKAWSELEVQKHTLHLDLLKSSQSLAAAEGKAAVLHEEVDKTNILGRLGTWLGVILIVCGFGLWYFREQRYIDRKSRGEANGQAKSGEGSEANPGRTEPPSDSDRTG